MQSRAQSIPGRRQTTFQAPRTSKGNPMDLHALWYVLAALMVIVGLAGTLLPAPPGLPLVFAGLFLAAWADGIERVDLWWLLVLGSLPQLPMLMEFGRQSHGAGAYE